MTGLGADMTVELVGTAEALTSASFRTAAGSPEGFYAGDHIIWFVERFAPDNLAFVIDSLMRASCSGGLEGSAELEGGAELADRTIMVTTGRGDEGPLGEETMSIVITVST